MLHLYIIQTVFKYTIICTFVIYVRVFNYPPHSHTRKLITTKHINIKATTLHDCSDDTWLNG